VRGNFLWLIVLTVEGRLASVEHNILARGLDYNYLIKKKADHKSGRVGLQDRL
jgi:hypothetical protein